MTYDLRLTTYDLRFTTYYLLLTAYYLRLTTYYCCQLVAAARRERDKRRDRARKVVQHRRRQAVAREHVVLHAGHAIDTMAGAQMPT